LLYPHLTRPVAIPTGTSSTWHAINCAQSSDPRQRLRSSQHETATEEGRKGKKGSVGPDHDRGRDTCPRRGPSAARWRARREVPARRRDTDRDFPAGRPRALLVDVHLWLQREHVKSVNATALSRWQQNTLRPYGVSPRLGSRPGVRRLRTARARPPSRGPGGFGRKVPGSARGGNRRRGCAGAGVDASVPCLPLSPFHCRATPSGRASGKDLVEGIIVNCNKFQKGFI